MRALAENAARVQHSLGRLHHLAAAAAAAAAAAVAQPGGGGGGNAPRSPNGALAIGAWASQSKVTATTCTLEFRKRDQNTGATTTSSATWRIEEVASALGVAVADVCWPFAITMVQSGGDMKKEATALARCAHSDKAGRKSAIHTNHRAPAGMDKAMLQRFVNLWSARALIRGSPQPNSPRSPRRRSQTGRSRPRRAHPHAPHRTNSANDTRVVHHTRTAARAAAGAADARSARATSVELRRNQRSCSAAAVLCGRFRLALASSSRNQRTAQCATRHARNTLHASLHKRTHHGARQAPHALAMRPRAATRELSARGVTAHATSVPEGTDTRTGTPPHRPLAPATGGGVTSDPVSHKSAARLNMKRSRSVMPSARNSSDTHITLCSRRQRFSRAIAASVQPVSPASRM